MQKYYYLIWAIGAILLIFGGGVIFQILNAPAAPNEEGEGTYAVSYTDSTGYIPNTLTIKKGGRVVFKNESSKEMWVASQPHPTHTLYPKSGGCIGSIFDSCRGIPTGNFWSFTFDVSGTWQYHNHLHPRYTGIIIVQ